MPKSPLRFLSVLMVAMVGCANLPEEQTAQTGSELRWGFRRGDGPSQPGGSGLLETRILVNNDGSSDFEAASGDIDGLASPVGSIDQLSLQVFAMPGATGLNQDYPSVGDWYFWRQLRGPQRSQSFEVRGKVLSFNGVETVTVPGVVRLRPDLSFAGIIGPERPDWIIGPERPNGIIGPERLRAGRPVFLFARVFERNGDLGAVARCELWVNGEYSKSSEAFYVNAGGSSLCRMRHVFQGRGPQQVELRVRNIRPGDFDPTNQSLYDSVTIIGPE